MMVPENKQLIKKIFQIISNNKITACLFKSLIFESVDNITVHVIPKETFFQDLVVMIITIKS